MYKCMQGLSNLPYPDVFNKQVPHVLERDLFLDPGIVIPEGTTVGLLQSRNFGWLILKSGTKDSDGRVVENHIWKW